MAMMVFCDKPSCRVRWRKYMGLCAANAATSQSNRSTANTNTHVLSGHRIDNLLKKQDDRGQYQFSRQILYELGRIFGPFYSADAKMRPMSALQRPSDFFDADEIARLRRISPWRSAGAVLHCWGVIFATWALVAVWTNPLTVLLGIMVIGARQLGLFVLSHDGAHYALTHNRKLNDWISEWLLGRALTGEGIEGYRRYHLQHHAHTQQAEDPDLALSRPFPISPQSFRRKVWRDLSGQTGWKQYGEMFKQAFQGDTQGAAWRNLAQRGDAHLD